MSKGHHQANFPLVPGAHARPARVLTESLAIRGDTVATSGSWKARGIVATAGNQSLLGAILIATLGYATSNPPRIVSAAEITEDGGVVAFFQKRGEDGATLTRLCSVEDLVNNFRGLADALKLSDDDRTALFTELRKWIAKDHRVEPASLG